MCQLHRVYRSLKLISFVKSIKDKKKINYRLCIYCLLRFPDSPVIVYFRKHTYSLLELHISITESEQITNTQIYKYTTYKVAKEKQMENN